MKVLVVGATGGIGRASCEQLLDAGHTVTALARGATKMSLSHDRLAKVDVDVLDERAVDEAVRGHDAVVVALGIPAKGKTAPDVCSVGTRHVLAAMKKHDVPRLACVTAWGVGDSWSKLPLHLRLGVKLLMSRSFADKNAQEQLVRSSDREWMIVRPTELKDTARREDVHVSTDGTVAKRVVARVDVAGFIADRLATPARETYVLSGK